MVFMRPSMSKAPVGIWVLRFLKCSDDATLILWVPCYPHRFHRKLKTLDTKGTDSGWHAFQLPKWNRTMSPMPRSIAQVKQPKYKLIKTGFLPLVSPSHSISPNLVGVFYIGITPHEPLWCFLPGWCWWVSLDILKRAWMWWVYMMMIYDIIYKYEIKEHFVSSLQFQFWMFGYQTGEVFREPWPQTHRRSG